jgi:hypothetical protein
MLPLGGFPAPVINRVDCRPAGYTGCQRAADLFLKSKRRNSHGALLMARDVKASAFVIGLTRGLR